MCDVCSSLASFCCIGRACSTPLAVLTLRPAAQAKLAAHARPVLLYLLQKRKPGQLLELGAHGLPGCAHPVLQFGPSLLLRSGMFNSFGCAHPALNLLPSTPTAAAKACLTAGTPGGKQPGPRSGQLQALAAHLRAAAGRPGPPLASHLHDQHRL